ncbi:MAG: type II secretion system F family protein, partial [Candidatus Omnitrophota bacterium]
MARFKYLVKDKGGKTLTGAIEAASKDSAIQSLRSRELTIVTLEQEKRKAFLLDISRVLKRKKIKIDELIIFSRQLATMVNAGIPLVTALDILAEQIEHVFFKEVVSKIRDDVETGSSLSEALGKHKNIFSTLFVNMVRAGESSGMLDEILDRVSTYLEKTSTLQKKIKSALMYPLVVTVMALGITTFLMIKVVPVFSEIYSGFGAELPLPTQVMLNISAFMRKYFYVAIGIFVMFYVFINRYVKTEKGKVTLDTLKLKLPVFGPLIRKVAVGKFTRTLSTLVRSGVPILSSLEIVSKTADNRVVEMAVNNVRENVKEGEPIAA